MMLKIAVSLRIFLLSLKPIGTLLVTAEHNLKRCPTWKPLIRHCKDQIDDHFRLIISQEDPINLSVLSPLVATCDEA
ncbi:hypothetical protein SHAQ108633_05195 [Shewanella aquimarina]